MSALTLAQLDHLCHLVALDLGDAEKQKLLPQLENILSFVRQLESCPTDDVGRVIEAPSVIGSLPTMSGFVDDFLPNIHHHIVHHMPQLKTGLKK